MVIDVTRLRVIRQSDPVCLFVCSFVRLFNGAFNSSQHNGVQS
jgi:hypothetical protein